MNFNENKLSASQIMALAASFLVLCFYFNLLTNLIINPAKECSIVTLDPVEERKERIALHLAARYKQSHSSVKAVVNLAWSESAKHAQVTPEIVLAIIQKESSLKASSASGYGAKGYMQVVRRYHEEKLSADESLHDAPVNIRVGTEVLQEYLTLKNGNIRAALVKYSGNARGYADFVIKEARALKSIA